eukprot:2688271-Rhodomonas_salina.1
MKTQKESFTKYNFDTSVQTRTTFQSTLQNFFCIFEILLLVAKLHAQIWRGVARDGAFPGVPGYPGTRYPGTRCRSSSPGEVETWLYLRSGNRGYPRVPGYPAI